MTDDKLDKISAQLDDLIQIMRYEMPDDKSGEISDQLGNLIEIMKDDKSDKISDQLDTLINLQGVLCTIIAYADNYGDLHPDIIEELNRLTTVRRPPRRKHA